MLRIIAPIRVAGRLKAAAARRLAQGCYRSLRGKRPDCSTNQLHQDSITDLTTSSREYTRSKRSLWARGVGARSRVPEERSVDLHQNIFYSYRGPTADNADRDRQIENNLTKALINTLSLGGESVWLPFLRDLALPVARDARFVLQRRDLPSGMACQKRDRVLLGISPVRSDWEPAPTSHAAYVSVPDAWIYGDGFAVLVECKANGDFTADQMSSHLTCLGGSSPARVEKKGLGRRFTLSSGPNYRELPMPGQDFWLVSSSNFWSTAA